MRRLLIGLFLSAWLALGLLPAAYADGLFAGSQVPATPRFYPGSGICSTTLQACLNSSNDGDIVTILPGTYITT